MTFSIAAPFFCALGTLLLLWLSSDIEFRERRWPKILVSQPILLALAAFFTVLGKAPATPFFLGIGVMSLWLIWREELAHHVGQPVMGVLYGGGRAGGSVVPTFSFAQKLINDDELKDAEKEIIEQLAKDPHNFEGRRMLAAIYQEWKQPDKAIAQLDQALLRPDIPESHVEFITEAKEQLLEMKRQTTEGNTG